MDDVEKEFLVHGVSLIRLILNIEGGILRIAMLECDDEGLSSIGVEGGVTRELEEMRGGTKLT